MSMKRGFYFLFLFFVVGALPVNALCVPHAVQGQVFFDGVAGNADGASVVLIDKNTNATITDIVGPLGNAGVSGWHALDLGNLDPCPSNGDVIDIIASKNGYNGRAMFTYDSSSGYTIPETIEIESINSKVTRSFSNNTPSQCEEIIVSLKVDLNGFDSFYAIDEEVPAGWTISDPGTGDTSEPGHIKWEVFQSPENITYQYTVAVPCNASGIYSFDGIYIFESDLVEKTILGATDVDVQEVLFSKEIALKQGWNLISLPVEPLNLSVEGIFGADKLVFGYDTDWFAATKIDTKLGYWVKSNETINITVLGEEITNTTISLNTGWNLVGYPYLTEKNITEVYGNVSVYAFNGTWLGYNPQKTTNSLQILKPGYGYWVLN